MGAAVFKEQPATTQNSCSAHCGCIEHLHAQASTPGMGHLNDGSGHNFSVDIALHTNPNVLKLTYQKYLYMIIKPTDSAVI